MIVVPAGKFLMGSPPTEPGHDKHEEPQHPVTIPRAFAVGKFDVTFAQWDTCMRLGGCPAASDGSFGRGARPAIDVSWYDAELYAKWLSRTTGRPYRLLSEAEWEYAARAATTTAYYWGDEVGKGNADCDGCGSRWDGQETAPIGSFKPNAFGLYDMAGNVWQWVQDCFRPNYQGAPEDGSVWTGGNCNYRVVRGGSWHYPPRDLRAAHRDVDTPGTRYDNLGFRVARTITP